jgi:hypothetical protein
VRCAAHHLSTRPRDEFEPEQRRDTTSRCCRSAHVVRVGARACAFNPSILKHLARRPVRPRSGCVVDTWCEARRCRRVQHVQGAYRVHALCARRCARVRRRGECLRADACGSVCVPPPPCAGCSAALLLRGSQRPPEAHGRTLSGEQHFAAVALLPDARAHGGGAVAPWTLHAATGAPVWRALRWLEAQRFLLCRPTGSPQDRGACAEVGC